MPWPLDIVRELFDLQTHNLLRLPIPELSLAKNVPIIAICRHALDTLIMLSKPDSKWDKSEEALFIQIENTLAE